MTYALRLVGNLVSIGEGVFLAAELCVFGAVLGVIVGSRWAATEIWHSWQ